MTIENRVINSRLSHLEDAIESAPEEAYKQARTVVEIIHDTSNQLLATMRGNGLHAGNDDRLRNVEVALYNYILQSNPDLGELISAEGYGEHIKGPAGERVKAQLIADTKFLQSFDRGPA